MACCNQSILHAVFLLILLTFAGPGHTAAQPALLPAPSSIQLQQGQFQLTTNTRMQLRGEGAARAATYLAKLLQQSRGLTLQPQHSDSGTLILQVDPRSFAAGTSAEAYRLEVSPQRVHILAADARGLFYGAISLWQLASSDAGAGAVSLPAVRIDDSPRFPWRGYLLDSARHYETVEQIELLLDMMAVHKLNTFHWHLTDDQGWRLEIRAYPQLTRIGGCRAPAEDAGGAPLCGWYNQQDIRHLVRYAAERNINIVPEIDVPGHATAAIAAYPELGVSDQPIAVSNQGGIHANLFNVEESTFAFLDTVLGEIAELFPGPFVHIGGDEAIKNQWNDSAQVQQRMRELGIADTTQLQSYFIGRMQNSLARRGKRLIGWDEILEGGLPPQATVMSWRGIEGGIEAARQGHDVVMSPTHSLYLDYLQTASASEPHGRLALIPLRQFYAFEPVPERLSAKQRRHVLGLQANMWTGALATFATIQHNTLPRLAAMAETGWSPATRKDYADFLQRLPAQLRRYRALGLAYAQTPFEVAVAATGNAEGSSITVTLSAGLDYPIHYTVDGSLPQADSPRYQGPFQANMPLQLRAATFHLGERLSAVADHHLDASWLRRRDDTQLTTCPGAPGPALRLAGHGQPGQPRPLYNVDIMVPCWLWADAPLQQIRQARIRAARLPYGFHLTAAEEAKRHFLPAASASGEVDIRAGGCDGSVIGNAVLPARTTQQGPVELQVPIRSDVDRADLCIRFTGDTRPAMWVLDTVELLH
jgi:hexosaminidase